jgi:hypothetical protein
MKDFVVFALLILIAGSSMRASNEAREASAAMQEILALVKAPPLPSKENQE